MGEMMNIEQQVQAILDQASELMPTLVTTPAWQLEKSKFLGKQGLLAALMQGLKDISIEERKHIGMITNQAKDQLEAMFDAQRERIDAEELRATLSQEAIDVTLPGEGHPLGSMHPLTQVIEDIEDLFIGLGYRIEEGPEVESDEFNFEKLNLPKDHPARDMQDSFYITTNTLLRTHTSPVQVRTLLAKGGQQPLQILCPGKVYRRDDDDATHSHQFTQIEGLVVDQHISMADLKGTLELMVHHLFGDRREIRLRPSYFPFTEPSVEVDVSWGTTATGETRWMEILGAGMVHDHVLRMSGYDPAVYSGFAFGIGVERIAMLRHGIEDIRSFYTNDQRFLSQLKGVKG
jgi:phenylalanyl-tRNA synthetase alpha chain